MMVFNSAEELHTFITKKFKEEGKVQECRRLETEVLELLNVDIAVSNKIVADLASKFPYFFKYFAGIRLEFMKDVFAKQIKRIIKLLCDDNTTRRAYILTFDFFWKQHPPCVVATQALIRNKELMLIVYLRSSDYYKVLPYDLYSSLWLQRILCDNTGTTPGPVVFHIGCLHIYQEDWKAAGIDETKFSQ